MLTRAGLRRYAQEVDVDFVRRSIKAIGQTAIKIDEAAERCVNVLLELIGTRVSYVVQEAVVVMKVRCVTKDSPSRLYVLQSVRTYQRILVFVIGYFPEIPINV